MSSKSLGKSVNSVVKSVESLLPKGINLKHVLLGLLVGLLICMMFGQTVEGLTPQSDKGATDYTCANGETATTILTNDEATAANRIPGISGVQKDDILCKSSQGQYTTNVPTLKPQQPGGNNNNIHTNCTLPNPLTTGYKVQDGTTSINVSNTPTALNTLSCDTSKNYSGTAMAACQSDGAEVQFSGCSLPTPASSNDGCASAPDSNYNPTGICMPSGVDSDNFYSRGCFANTSEDACPTDGGCEWASTNEVDSSGTLNQEGLDLLLNFVGLKKYQCSGDSANLKSGFTQKNLDEIKNTKLLPIMGIVNEVNNTVESVLPNNPSVKDPQTGLATSQTTNADWMKLHDPDTPTNPLGNDGKFKDLLYWLFSDASGSMGDLENESDPDQWASAISGSDKIPENLKDPLSDVVTACAQAWKDDKIKDIYPHNGGRPIIGLDPHAGAVCRNTPYKPRVEVINEWRLHIGEGCPGAVSTTDKKFVTNGEKYVCSPNQKTCSTASGESFTDRAVNAIDSQNPFSIDNRCSLSSCRSDAQLCPTQYFADATGGVFDNLLNKGKNALNIV